MATLVVIAIIAVLAAVLYGGTRGEAKSPRADGKGKTILGLSKAKAQDEVCRSNLAQTRSGIQIARTNADDTPPERLEDIRIGAQFYKCPMGNEPYVYDPQTGEVKCPHPGHEKY